MKLFLAGTSSRKWLIDELSTSDYILESFFYFNDWQLELIKTSKMFLVDSGAFTFIWQNSSMDDYLPFVESYINFLKKNNIKYFFEMDIDNIVGLEKVEEYRDMIEQGVGRKVIPVFHKSRGIDKWHEICEAYDYVAIGTMNEFYGHTEVIEELCKIANSYGVKVHGLGYTAKEALNCGFYSVDSTSWLSGSRYGQIYQMTNAGMKQIKAPKGKKLKLHHKDIDRHNVKQWIKYQKILDSGVRM